MQGGIRTDVDSLRIHRDVPGRVQVSDTAGQVGTTFVERFDIVGVLRNPVVDGVNCLDKFLQYLNTEGVRIKDAHKPCTT